ncbi:MAG: TonB-dependent receptor [Bacteroidales bacterium]|nr:TonB-dependent receptor [Bacteroidales bacterium]
MNKALKIILLALGGLLLSLHLPAQSVSLKLNGVTVKRAITELQAKSGYSFVYVAEDIDTQRIVNVNANNLNTAVSQIIEGQDLTYEIQGRSIIISKKTRTSAKAPSDAKTVKGYILDGDGAPLPGATVQVGNSQRIAMADQDGAYEIQVAPNEQILVSFMGMTPQFIRVSDQRVINVELTEDNNQLEEAVAVAFGTQKKESVLASITTVKPAELKVPSSDLTTSFAGKIAGMISYQRTGEPGEDTADFFIRGVTTFGTGKANPLILIDGVEMTTTDLARLTTDDIASFSIMKDANATALYGARGANGVILVTTKEGREGSVKVQLRAEGSWSGNASEVEISDPVTFMRLHNEAVRTRNPQSRLPYDEKKINYTERGIDPLYYPAIDWRDMLFKDHAFNQRYNLNISGGGKIARYYIAANWSKDNGILNVDKRQSFNNNIDLKKYGLRANVNVNATKTTEIIVRLQGMFDDYTGPIDGGSTTYSNALQANPVLFQPYYEPDEANLFVKHILYGNYGTGSYINPYAESLRGYKQYDRSTMLAQFEARQKLDFITKGLSARALFNIKRYSYREVWRGYSPFYYLLSPKVAGQEEVYALTPLNEETGNDYLSFSPQSTAISNSMYMEAALQYNRTFAKRHEVSGLLVYTIREEKDNAQTSLLLSLPHRNMGLAGRFTYDYDKRYFVEANFGYNGSERFAEKERWGFFPSAGLGWIVSNEPWMKPSARWLSKLKLKATYGLVGNDEIGSATDRFFYMSNVDMNSSGRGATFGDNWGYSRSGISISRYEDPSITWEISHKTNLGFELGLWNELEIQADFYHEYRTNILQPRSDIPSTMGLQAIPSANIGEASGRGVDVSVDWNKSFKNGSWMTLRGNFTYATSRYEKYEEPAYEDEPWRSHVGNKISQGYGLIAERLFIDDEDVANSPRQDFGEYGAGDIKYKDLNGDNVVDTRDVAPIGFPLTPEIIYGFGVSFGVRNFDFSTFLQGSARSSFFISPGSIAPFVGGQRGNRALLKVIENSYWSEDNRDLFAFWPRLSSSNITNNEHASTWWMRDGSFLRVKTLEIGYSLPRKWVRQANIDRVRFYVSGSNLLSLSKFKLWDVEQAGNAFNYPIQRVINLGVDVEF